MVLEHNKWFVHIKWGFVSAPLSGNWLNLGLLLKIQTIKKQRGKKGGQQSVALRSIPQLDEQVYIQLWWDSGTFQGTLGWMSQPDQSGPITITTSPLVVVISQCPTFSSVTSPLCYCSVYHRQHRWIHLPLSNGALDNILKKSYEPEVAGLIDHSWTKEASLVLAISGTSVRNGPNPAGPVLNTNFFLSSSTRDHA